MSTCLNDDIKRKILERFNKELGTDYKNLKKCQSIKDNLLEEKSQYLKLLNYNADDNTSTFSIALNQLNHDCQEAENITTDFKNLSNKVTVNSRQIDNTLKKLEEYVYKIQCLERTVEYVKISKKISDISSEIHQSLQGNDDELSVTLYANLCEISLNLQDCPAKHLLLYLKDVIHHWHNHLKEKFSVKFDELLKIIKWPFVNTNTTLAVPPADSIQKLQLLSEYLIQIQLPEESATPMVTSALLSDFPTLSLPILFLIRPLRKRFVYHFYGNKQTNRADKPEWYMTQILIWIRDHERFIHNTIQPVIDRLALFPINAKLEFMRGLVQLCVEKLDAELPSLAFDDALFSHCVDEALGMDRELTQVYNYPKGQPGPLGPLTRATILQKWLTMEKKYALEKMDAMLLSDMAWNILQTTEDEEMKVTECGNAFMTLLATMTERYQPLPQPGHRLQFLDLQLDLLDDFRIRLLQLLHEDNNDDFLSSKSPQILNTINYVTSVLIEWSETIHFIHLHYFKHQFSQHGIQVTTNQPTSDELNLAEEGCVFDEILLLYNHMKQDLILTLSETVVLDIKARSRAYRRDSWHLMPLLNNVKSYSLTTSACPMFQLLATRLHQLKENLTRSLFIEMWKIIAKQLDIFFLEELIMENHFNEGGATQLKFDVTRNLIPLFGQYANAEPYFIRTKEACSLLTLPKGVTLLLKEELPVSDAETQKEMLLEHFVKKTDVKTALLILNQRVDIKQLK